MTAPIYMREIGPDYGNIPILRDGNTVRQVNTQETRNGRHWDFVQIGCGESWSFPEIKGPACISTIWMTLSPYRGKTWKNAWETGNFLLDFLDYRQFSSLREVWLKIYFDNEPSPSVCAPIGNFFGPSFGEYRHYNSQFLGMTSGGYVCLFPMPFAKSCRIVIENTNQKKFLNNFYGAITYNLLDTVEEDVGYFHARCRREPHPKKGVPYTVLEATGPGHYVGCNLSVKAHKMGNPLKTFSFLEGDWDFFIDRDSKPTISYTATEDYFQGGWYFIKGPFCTPTHGLIIKNRLLSSFFSKIRVSAYRFHVHDPISFQNGIKVVCHHGEWDEVDADYRSMVYWYQKEAHSDFFDKTEGGTPKSKGE